ncbi:hypothetical protein Tco_1327032 [Tanacetum coccineum]
MRKQKRMKNLKNTKTKAYKKKKRKGKKDELVENEMVEAEMVESESNEEPPLRKKKLDAPSFVDVRKLKGDMLVLKGAEKVSKKAFVGDKRKKDNVEAKKETVKKKVVAAERQVSIKKGKQKIIEGSLVSFKEGKKDKDEGVLMVVEKGKEVVLNEKVKCDLVNILTRISPSHLMNVLDSLTTQRIKALLLDTDDKIKISLDENPKDIDLKMIIEKRLAFFKELNHRDDDNAMVVLDNGNDVPEESVKDNEVLNEKDDVTEKQKDVEKMFELDGKNTVQEFNREKYVEKVVNQDVDKPEDVEKESEFGNDENHNDSENKKNKGVLAINEDPLKDSQSETSIFDSQPKDSQPEVQDSQPGMEKGAEIQEENLEPLSSTALQVRQTMKYNKLKTLLEWNCKTLEEADFPSTGLEDIESLKGGRRNLFDEKSTVENVNEDDMILQDSLLNLPFLSTQEVSCLDIDTQKTPQIQKQGLQEESSQIQKHEIPKSFHTNKLKLAKYVLPDAQATGEKRQEVMLNETSMESVDFKGGHPTAKRQQIKKAMEGEKNVPKIRGKKKDADKQDIKKPQVRKQNAAQLAKSKETKATTMKPAPTKRKKNEPNDKEETDIYASPISFIPPPIDTESEKRQGKPSNFLVLPFYQRKVILDEPVFEEGKKIVE